jgi:uncharacterized protein with PIN domain
VKQASFRFYAELNDFLPTARRGIAFTHAFTGTPSVKDVVEALGVPHTEIDLVLADGVSVDFGWRLHDGARVGVYPVFESIDVAEVTRVRAAPLRELRFVLDVHLGRLARHLRMLGFDAAWDGAADDAALAATASREHRILLTRDRGLLKRRAVTHGYCVRASAPRLQLTEVVRRLDLARAITPFSRCLRCNGLLVPVAKAEVADRLPPRVRERQQAFRRCAGCGRVYWAGTHHERMTGLVASLREPPRRDEPEG